MLFTAKSIAAAALQLNVYLILGIAFSRAFLASAAGKYASRPEGDVSPAAQDPFAFYNAGFFTAAGFVLYHALFWILTYPWSLLDLPFQTLVVLWGVLLILFLCLSLITAFREIAGVYRHLFCAAVRNARYTLPLLIAVFFLIVTASRNQFLDIDSQTYIGEVSTILGTGRISAFDPATGLLLSRFNFLKRGCSMFGAESAFWCRVLSVHPLLYCRYIRTALNFLLLFTGTYGVLRELFIPLRSSLTYLLLACPSLLLFDNSGFTNTRFLMHRTYEGKAFLGGTLLLFTVLLCLRFIRVMRTGTYVLLFANELAALSVSATALYLLPPLLFALLGSAAVLRRKWKLLPALVLLILPNLAFALLQFMG